MARKFKPKDRVRVETISWEDPSWYTGTIVEYSHDGLYEVEVDPGFDNVTGPTRYEKTGRIEKWEDM